MYTLYLPSILDGGRLYSDEGFDSTKSVYTAKLKELTDLGEPVENRLYEEKNRPVRCVKCFIFCVVGRVCLFRVFGCVIGCHKLALPCVGNVRVHP